VIPHFFNCCLDIIGLTDATPIEPVIVPGEAKILSQPEAI